MNQILNTPKYKKYKKIFIFQLIFSLIVIVLSLWYLLYSRSQDEKMKNLSKTIMQPYSISRLYNGNNIELNISAQNSPYVIGTLEIPSLKLTLPVMSEMNDNLLKISVCRFYGPKHISPRKYMYCWA